MRWPWRRRTDVVAKLDAVRQEATPEPCMVCGLPIALHSVEQAGYCQARMRAMVDRAEIRVSDLDA